MATHAGDIFKEINALARGVGKLTDGQACIELMEDWDTDVENGNEDTYATGFHLYISPDAGCYKGARFTFKVLIPKVYPDEPPKVMCQNKVYHPNIDTPDGSATSADVCVNLLSDDWSGEVGLDGCVMAVLFLFHHPEVEDALSPVFPGNVFEEGEFERNVQASLRGEIVDGEVYDKLIVDPVSTEAETGAGGNEVDGAEDKLSVVNVPVSSGSNYTPTPVENGKPSGSIGSGNTPATTLENGVTSMADNPTKSEADITVASPSLTTLFANYVFKKPHHTHTGVVGRVVVWMGCRLLTWLSRHAQWRLKLR